MSEWTNVLCQKERNLSKIKNIIKNPNKWVILFVLYMLTRIIYKSAKRRANLRLHLTALSVYKRGMDSERHLPCIMSSVKVAPFAAAAVVPPRLPECSP